MISIKILKCQVMLFLVKKLSYLWYFLAFVYLFHFWYSIYYILRIIIVFPVTCVYVHSLHLSGFKFFLFHKIIVIWTYLKGFSFKVWHLVLTEWLDRIVNLKCLYSVDYSITYPHLLRNFSVILSLWHMSWLKGSIFHHLYAKWLHVLFFCVIWYPRFLSCQFDKLLLTVPSGLMLDLIGYLVKFFFVV